jgi:hypothetical protein
MATKDDMLNRAKHDYEEWRKNSGDYQSRFCFEFIELNDRINKLQEFINNGFQGVTEQYRKDRLKIQLKIMEAYREILNARFEDSQL